jgi:hypothetical protein
MMRKILLVEPGYKNKYPPLGLMKIAQYHKQKGDRVEFVKGLSSEKRDKCEWDRIYVSSLFTYDWDITIKTLKYYRYSVAEPASENLIIGGILATLMSDDITKEVNCKVVAGLLNEKGKLSYEDDDKIDSMIPDYSILEEITYNYPVSNAYIIYSTRGCVRKCEFCAVPTIEPQYVHYLPIKKQIESIKKIYGAKKDLMLLDNNVLASRHFEKIIKTIKSLGFEKGALFKYKNKAGQNISVQRSVDFNQGIDARLLDEEKMALLSEIAIRPLRIAFDDIAYKDLYESKIRLAAKYGIKHLSNYILFNFKDKPEDFYKRLKINLDLNEELGLQIYSFPMRYISLKNKDRSMDSQGNVGCCWNKKYLRAVQCVLNVTRGVVSPNKAFFQRAFGVNIDDFKRILLMPEDYIMERDLHRDDGSAELWWRQYNDLSVDEQKIIKEIIFSNDFTHLNLNNISGRIRKVLNHYRNDEYFQPSLELENRTVRHGEGSIV